MCEHYAKFLGNDYCFQVHTSVDTEDRGCLCCGVNDDGQECCWYEPQEEEEE